MPRGFSLGRREGAAHGGEGNALLGILKAREKIKNDNKCCSEQLIVNSEALRCPLWAGTCPARAAPAARAARGTGGLVLLLIWAHHTVCGNHIVTVDCSKNRSNGYFFSFPVFVILLVVKILRE